MTGTRDRKVGQGPKGESAKTRQSSALTSYAAYLSAKGIRSKGQYLAEVSAFFAFLDSYNLAFDEVTPHSAREFRTYLVTECPNLAKGTINNKLRYARSFYRFAHEAGLVFADPFSHLCGLRTGRHLSHTVLTIDEMGILLNGFAERCDRDLMLRAACELLYGSALRISEVGILKLEDVNETDHTLNVFEPKTQNSRTVPATEVSLRVLRRYRDLAWSLCVDEQDRSRGFLFPQGGTTTLRVAVNAALKKECHRLKVPVITSHGFRHAAATHMLTKGAGLRQVQSFLGHESILSTQGYTHLVTRDLLNVIERCHPREAA